MLTLRWHSRLRNRGLIEIRRADAKRQGDNWILGFLGLVESSILSIPTPNRKGQTMSTVIIATDVATGTVVDLHVPGKFDPLLTEFDKVCAKFTALGGHTVVTLWNTAVGLSQGSRAVNAPVLPKDEDVIAWIVVQCADHLDTFKRTGNFGKVSSIRDTRTEYPELTITHAKRLVEEVLKTWTLPYDCDRCWSRHR